MKIGIITYHRSHNYGALLQAIALRKVLDGMGYKVTFIDYWPSYHKHLYQLFSFARFLKVGSYKYKISYMKNCLFLVKQRKRRKDAFENFIESNITPFVSGMDEHYDVVIHGSDQIWRKQDEMNTYNPVYFGKHSISTKLKVTYAASMGTLPTQQCDVLKLKDLLSNLDGISVREQKLLEFVKSLGYHSTRLDLDPTLLMDACQWIKMFNLKKKPSSEKYALYYTIMDSFNLGMIERFANSKGLKLKVLHRKAISKESNTQISTADPAQFLDLIYNADFVFTSSFHGLAFSLIFNKPFLASFTHNSERAASLLTSLDLADHLVPSKSKLPEKVSEVNYLEVNERLKEMRAGSMTYLENLQEEFMNNSAGNE